MGWVRIQSATRTKLGQNSTGVDKGFFSKAARSVLRHIRVNSKHELKQRIIEFINDLNRDPVIHRWRYKIDLTA